MEGSAAIFVSGIGVRSSQQEVDNDFPMPQTRGDENDWVAPIVPNIGIGTGGETGLHQVFLTVEHCGE